jgi:hypothetical protein
VGRRPSNGDTIVCPKCGKPTAEFSERYRLPSTKGAVVSTPAWVCDSPSCGYVRFARADDDPILNSPTLRTASMKLRTDAKRTLMKSRFVRQMAKRVLAKSRARKKQ